MLSDYVMNSIDNLFSDKLIKNNTHLLQNSRSSKPNFNKNIIKSQLSTIIRKDNQQSRSPACRKDKSISPVNKSRLKNILQNNRSDNIRSVVKKTSTSPYKPIENQQITPNRSKLSIEVSLNCERINKENKENDLIRYYREERKSMEKITIVDRNEKSMGKGRKSRIFRPPALSHQVSKAEFR